MKRAIPVLVAVIVLVGVFAVMRFSGGCNGTAKTRIAQKKLYEGPSTLPASATEWPKWRGPLGDGISRETDLADKWPPSGPTELWTADVGIGYSSPIAAAGRVYLFSLNDDTETLTCFDANSGRIIWNQPGGRGRTNSYPGTRATPTIDGGDIFTLGGTGDLICRDVASGNQRWTINILAETGATPLDWGVASTPLVSGNLVFVQTGQGGPVAIAVNRANGSISWRSEAQTLSGYASPILVDVEGSPQLVVFGGKRIYGMDPQDGRTLWDYQWNTSYDVHASTPIYRDGRLFLTSGYGSGSVMLQLSKNSAPKELWQSKFAQSRFQPAILDGDAIYANSEGKMTCLGWNDARLFWQDADNKLKLGLGGSFVRIPGDRMITLGERGWLTLAKITPAGIDVISTAKGVEGTQVWSMPLIYGGRLYVKGEQELVCYDIAGGGTTQPSTRAVAER
jgi:outer membrane protein assembly factor BamB